MSALIVYLNERPIGRLTDENGRMSFAYDSAYASDRESEPLSFSLPLRGEPFSHEEVEPFLSGLLPEDIIRTRLGRILQIPRDYTFGFLSAIGGDCAGAIAFYPEHEGPGERCPRFRVLSDDEAGLILDNLESKPLDIGEEGFRISGAGAQDKLIACWRDGHLELPLDGTPSTHIVKTAIRDFPDSVENECFSMWLAKACGLDVAECEIAVIGGKRRFVTKRYDRSFDGGVVKRLHQEDFCQLLGIDPKRKYEALGGPGIEDVFALIRKLSLPAVDLLEFIRRIIFLFLVGDGDAHGKNFSIVYLGRRPALAPMYDVMSTAIYPEISPRMAMKIDGEYAFKWITRGKFIRLAEKNGIDGRLMNRELDHMIDLVLKQSPIVEGKLAKIASSGVYHRIGERIRKHTQQLAAC